MLTDIENYCDKCQLKIKTTKTKVMIFDKGRCNTIHDFFLYNEKLENVKYFKYLGIYFSKNGSWLRSQKVSRKRFQIIIWLTFYFQQF